MLSAFTFATVYTGTENWSRWSFNWSFNTTDSTLTILSGNAGWCPSSNNFDFDDVAHYIVEEGVTGYIVCMGCSNLRSVNIISSSIDTIGEYGFEDCKKLETVSIASGYIDCWSFVDSPIKNLYLGDGVSYIGTNAFSGDKLNSLEIGSVTEIADFAFNNPKQLETLILHEGLVKIGEANFSHSKIKSLIIPNSVTFIGEDAFAYCDSLKTVTIGAGTQTLDRLVFLNCVSLKDMYCLATTPPMAIIAGVPGMCSNFQAINFTTATLHVPAGAKDTYKTANDWSNFQNIVDDAVDRSVIDNFTSLSLVDGTAYDRIYLANVDNLTYTRTFSSTNWVSLYVPFDMEYTDWSTDFDVAKICAFHQYDRNNDGTVDDVTLEVLKLGAGSKVNANYPYLIRPKQAGPKTITLSNVVLQPGCSRSINCSSVDNLYTFTGNYASKAIAANSEYFMDANGCLVQAANATTLNPFRWYMTVSNRDGYPVASNLSGAPIRVVEQGEETTELNNVEETIQPIKMIKNGQMIILKNGHIYSTNGQMIE